MKAGSLLFAIRFFEQKNRRGRLPSLGAKIWASLATSSGTLPRGPTSIVSPSLMQGRTRSQKNSLRIIPYSLNRGLCTLSLDFWHSTFSKEQNMTEKKVLAVDEQTVDFYGDEIITALVEVDDHTTMYVPIK